MTALSRAVLTPCLMLCLSACIDPPTKPKTTTTTKAGPGQAEAKAGATPYPKRDPATLVNASAKPNPDPIYAGEPLSKAELPGGIVVEEFLIGEGDEAKLGSSVSVHYYGTLTDGTMFDTSLKRGKPFSFPIGQGRVIKGWDQGVPGMKVGGKRRLTIPSELAYGPRDKGKIPPNSTLVFTIELVDSVGPFPEPQGPEGFSGEPAEKSEAEGGLIIQDYLVGEGHTAATGDKVFVHYTGTLEDGTEFDSSVPRKKPLEFVLGTGRVIKGWDQGIVGMKEGGLRRLEIPAALAYGERAKGKIPANSTLIFTIELMAARKAPAPPMRRTPPQPHPTKRSHP